MSVNSRYALAATIIQLSDFHLFSPPHRIYYDLFSKRLYGRLAWRRRRHELRPDILAAMIDDIRSQAADLVAVTGDLTHLGFRDEYLKARALLEKLGSPERVMVIPGNHDAYVAGAWEKNYEILAPYLAGDEGAIFSRPPLYPVSRSFGKLAVIALNTAVPRPLWLATGRLGAAQLAGLEEKLEFFSGRSRVRVILMHHPPVPGLAGWRRRLSDDRVFLEVVAGRGAELVLFGHLHYRWENLLAAGKRRIPCFGVPAAAALGRSPARRSRYNIYRFYRAAGKTWRLKFVIRRWSESRSLFLDEECGEYELAGCGKDNG